jgi:proteasome lid subunit RPN8/RPN11
MPQEIWNRGGYPLRRLPDGRAFPPIEDGPREQAVAHALAEWPNESCGVLILHDGGVQKYHPARNVHPTPRTHFQIARRFLAEVQRDGQIIGVLHSHPHSDPRTGEGLCPSEADTVTQLEWAVPFYITALTPRQTYLDFFGWGDELPAPPLRERQFRHAVTDCYALVRHAFFAGTGVVLKDFPRRLSWWADPQGPNPIEEGLSAAGCTPVELDDLQPGDGLLFSLKSGIIQHCGLYLGGDLFMHHLHGRLSAVDPLPQWRRFLRKTVRYAPGAR